MQLLFIFTVYKGLGRYLQQQSSMFLEVTSSLSSFMGVKHGMSHTHNHNKPAIIYKQEPNINF